MKCQIHPEREAIGRFMTRDGQKYYLCEVCSKGLEPAKWWERRSSKQRKVIKGLAIGTTITVICVLCLVWFFVFRMD